METLKFSRLSETQQFQAIQALANGIMDELLAGSLMFPDEDVQEVVDLIKVKHLSVALTTAQQRKVARVQKLLKDTARDVEERKRGGFRRELERLYQTSEIQEYLLSIRTVQPTKFYTLVKSTEFSTLGRTRSLYDDYIMPLARVLAQGDRGYYSVDENGEVSLLVPGKGNHG